MRTLVFGVLILLAWNSNAQRDCATQDYIGRQTAADPSYAKGLAAAERFLQQTSAYFKMAAGPNIIQIPVVVHVLYNSAAQNISDEQVRSQIAALNRDFRRTNWDTVNTPARFKALAADMEIEFVLATADPKGRPTSGIVRKQTAVAEWTMDDKIKSTATGGSDAWDSKSYLNIWVGNMRRLLGYSSLPGGPADMDGVVIHTGAFGTINTTAPYNLGRTAVHEVGHWMGLKHIWGDTYCGDDGVGDTPTQGNFTSGCPTTFRTSCNNGTTGDMYMNYMDFTSDACINLFTLGQKERMRSFFNTGGPRATILASRGLNEPWLEEAPVFEEPVVEKSLRLYPNPVSTELVIEFPLDGTWTGRELRIVAINGVTVSRLFVSGPTQKVNTAALKPGLYMVLCDNGKDRLSQKLLKL